MPQPKPRSMPQPNPQPRSVQELIDRYNRELMATYRRQQPAPPAPQPTAVPAISAVPQGTPQPPTSGRTFSGREETLPEAAPDREEPTFPYEDDELADRPPIPIEPPYGGNTEEKPFVGYLEVFVFTGQTAEPLGGARVTVTRHEGDSTVLFADLVTDRDGLTPIVTLPSVNPELTMRPDIPQPYIAYDIRVSAPGYSTALYENVPVYGGNHVTQPAAMLPLTAGENPDVPRVYRSRGPADL